LLVLRLASLSSDWLGALPEWSLGLLVCRLDVGALRVLGLGNGALRSLAPHSGIRLDVVPGLRILTRLGELVRR
ncbi:MAG TPA: hypothetical protein QGG47_14945, partial [Acidobacteriota bacterium]|nr:hypothetical protein [Acidobacteriota bacterium]